MGEELEFGQLFYRTDDGQWTPFGGLKPADIVICDEMDEETYVSLPREGTIKCKCSIINPFTLTEKQKTTDLS